MRKIAQCLFLVFVSVSSGFGQSYSLDNSKSHLSIFGTSTLHDWEIKAEALNGNMMISTQDESFEIKSLSFKVLVNSLKSGKSMMDNNTYKAMEAEEYPSVSYKLNSAKVIGKTDGTFNLKAKGTLTIANTTKTIEMPVKAAMNSSQISYQGEITFNMSEYGIEPPTALLGSIKTGDEITIKFNVTYNN